MGGAPFDAVVKRHPDPKEQTMKYMVILKATADTEAGVMPPTEVFDTMGKFIEELVDDGVLLATDGLAASSKGARIYFDGDKRTVVDGPFTESKELIAGYWLVDMKSLDEVVERFKRCPVLLPGSGEQTDLEIRKVASMEDFDLETFTPEQREAVVERRAKAAEGN